MLQIDLSSLPDIYYFQDEDPDDGDGGKNYSERPSYSTEMQLLTVNNNEEPNVKMVR
jgi:hypothetical protein